MKKENPFKDWSEDALSHAVSMAVVSPHVKGETVDNMLARATWSSSQS